MPNPENIEKYKLKPGETLPGNGRPKGSKSMKTILREMLELKVDRPQGVLTEQWTKESKITMREVLVMQDIINAQKGNEKAKQRIWEYIEGKPDQHQTLEVKQPQTKEEMTAEIAKYAKNNGLTIQEYCDREGIDIDTLGNDVKLLDGNV
jgi:hypothetical protein